MRDIWVTTLKTSGARIYAVLIGLITLSLTARWLGPEGRGEIAAITTWVGTFFTFAYLSLGQVAINRASQSEGRSWLKGSLSTLLLLAVILTILGWLAAITVQYITSGSIFGSIPAISLILGFTMLPFMIWEQYSSSLLTALERLDIYNRYLIIGRTLALITIITLVYFGDFGVPGFIIGTVTGQIIICFGGLLMLYRLAGGLQYPSRHEISIFLKGGAKLHLNSIGVYLFTAADILMINYYIGTEETGFYQLGAQLMGVMLIVPQAASLVIYGKVSNLGADKAWNDQKKLLRQVLALMIVISLIAGSTAEWWIIWIVGEAFTPTIDIFRWQLLALIGMAFSTLMAPQWIGRGLFWQSSLLTVVIGIGNLTANSILIPKYGMYGAIWALIGVYSFAILSNGILYLWINHTCKINQLSESIQRAK